MKVLKKIMTRTPNPYLRKNLGGNTGRNQGLKKEIRKNHQKAFSVGTAKT